MEAYQPIPLVLSPLVSTTRAPYFRRRAYKHLDDKINSIRKSLQKLEKETAVFHAATQARLERRDVDNISKALQELIGSGGS